MLPLRMRLTATGPAEVSIGRSFHDAAPAALVRRSGCTASQIFFFCTLEDGQHTQDASGLMTRQALASLRRTCSPSRGRFAARRRSAHARPLSPPPAATAAATQAARVSRLRTSATLQPSRTSSTFSCEASDAARSMPKDLTPRMLRAFRLHSTTTRRPCKAQCDASAQLATAGVVVSCLQLLLRHVANEARADLAGSRSSGERRQRTSASG